MKLFTPAHIRRQLKQVGDEWVGQYGAYSLRSVFQPIWKKSLSEIYGYEGLIRVTMGGQHVNPLHFLTSFSDKTELTNVGGLCISLHLHNFALASLNKKIFLNVHPSMFARVSNDKYSIQKVLQRIAFQGIRSNQVVWEVTEFKERDTEKLLSGRAPFREAGNQIAIDDYGQLESNNFRVNLLNPDIVKIDRTLLQSYQNSINSDYLPNLLNSLSVRGFKIVLEGIENEREYETLQSLPHDFVQGYYFGKPRAIDCRLEKEGCI